MENQQTTVEKTRQSSRSKKESENSSTLLVLKAAWVLPITSEPLENACVILHGNTIENIMPENEVVAAIAGREHIIYDYGQAIILPGLINLHTHLEHTNLRSLAKEANFLDWLPKLMQETAKWSLADRARSAQQGIGEAVLAGTTFVVDFSYNGASIHPLAQSGIRALIGLETFGVNESSADKQWQQWLERREAFLNEEIVSEACKEGLISISAAPHAPYTVCPALWHKANAWAKENGLVLLTHLAESKEEYNWFNSDDKNLKQFLINAFSTREPDFGQFYEKYVAWKSPNRSSVEHLSKNGLLTDNLLAAHVVQVDDSDIALLKATNTAIAHCARSNAMLRCGKAPLKKFLTNNLRCGIGTDSAASSGSLNLLSECQFALAMHESDLHFFENKAKSFIELLTIKAAACLKLDHKLGSLAAGKLADLAVFSFPNNNDATADPYELLVNGKCNLAGLFVNGKTITLPSYGKATF